MDNNLNNEIEKKLYEMLPDYIFDSLDCSDKAFFEMHYRDYPDIENEVREGKILFSRMSSMNFDRVLGDHTRNISVKVLDKMEKYDRKNYGFSIIPKVILPSVGLVAILLIMLVPSILEFGDKEVVIDREAVAKIQNIKIEEPIEDEELDVVSKTINNLNSISINDDEINSYLDDEFDEIVDMVYATSPGLFWGNGANSNVAIMNEINKLSEDEFQEILEELEKNEKTLF